MTLWDSKITDYLLEARGKPSTWWPRGRLVEHYRSLEPIIKSQGAAERRKNFSDLFRMTTSFQLDRKQQAKSDENNKYTSSNRSNRIDSASVVRIRDYEFWTEDILPKIERPIFAQIICTVSRFRFDVLNIFQSNSMNSCMHCFIHTRNTTAVSTISDCSIILPKSWIGISFIWHYHW